MSREQPAAFAGAATGDEEMTREEVVAFFGRRQQAVDDLDAPALAADYAVDCVVESPTAGTHRGPAAVQGVFQAFFDGFPNLKLETERLVIDGCQVVQIARMTGTDLGGFMGLPPTDKTFHVSAVSFYELKGRRIVRERRIYDFTGLLVQIGVLKAKPV